MIYLTSPGWLASEPGLKPKSMGREQELYPVLIPPLTSWGHRYPPSQEVQIPLSPVFKDIHLPNFFFHLENVIIEIITAEIY